MNSRDFNVAFHISRAISYALFRCRRLLRSTESEQISG
jgi:hypothetical protein